MVWVFHVKVSGRLKELINQGFIVTCDCDIKHGATVVAHILVGSKLNEIRSDLAQESMPGSSVESCTLSSISVEALWEKGLKLKQHLEEQSGLVAFEFDLGITINVLLKKFFDHLVMTSINRNRKRIARVSAVGHQFQSDVFHEHFHLVILAHLGLAHLVQHLDQNGITVLVRLVNIDTLLTDRPVAACSNLEQPSDNWLRYGMDCELERRVVVSVVSVDTGIGFQQQFCSVFEERVTAGGFAAEVSRAAWIFLPAL